MKSVTLVQIKSCKDVKSLLDTIPLVCNCADEAAFLELRSRYDAANIKYIVNYETFTITS